MKEIRTSGPLMFSDPNCPTRVGEIINTISEIYDIPNPSEGMQVYVRDEKKTYTITGLKEAVIGGERVPNAKVDTFEAVKSKVENIDNNLAEMQEALSDGSFVVAVANLANAVKEGAVTFEMLNEKLQLSVSVVDNLETANTLMPLSANQGKILKELIDIINGTGEGSTDKKITDAIAALVDSAPENLDTLRELAEWIEKHGTEFAEVVKILQTHRENLANLNTTILNYNRKIGNYAPVDKATVVANLGTAVERGMIVTFYTIDGWKSIRYVSPKATAEAFANVDNWEDVDDFSAEDTETVVENIEETLVTEALRKTPQALSDDEKAQVRNNIGAISDQELFDQKELILKADSLAFETVGDSLLLQGEDYGGNNISIPMPAATTENAGVMSAEDKVRIHSYVQLPKGLNLISGMPIKNGYYKEDGTLYKSELFVAVDPIEIIPNTTYTYIGCLYANLSIVFMDEGNNIVDKISEYYTTLIEDSTISENGRYTLIKFTAPSSAHKVLLSGHKENSLGLYISSVNSVLRELQLITGASSISSEYFEKGKFYGAQENKVTQAKNPDARSIKIAVNALNKYVINSIGNEIAPPVIWVDADDNVVDIPSKTSVSGVFSVPDRAAYLCVNEYPYNAVGTIEVIIGGNINLTSINNIERNFGFYLGTKSLTSDDLNKGIFYRIEDGVVTTGINTQALSTVIILEYCPQFYIKSVGNSIAPPVIWADDNNNVVEMPSETSVNGVLTKPEGAKKAFINAYPDSKNGDFTLYVVPMSEKQSIDVKWTIPHRIYAVVGQEKSIYLDNIVNRNDDAPNYSVEVDKAFGDVDSRRFYFTPDAVGTKTITFNAWGTNGELVSSKQVNIEVVDNVVSSVKRVVCIGDSITEGQGQGDKQNNMPHHIKNGIDKVISSGADNIVFVGSKGTTVKHEGWWGRHYQWLANNQQSDIVSPLVNPNTNLLDIAYYRTQKCGLLENEKIDVVSLAMGFNNTNTENNANNAFSSMQAIISAFKADNPNTKFIVHLVTYPAMGNVAQPDYEERSDKKNSLYYFRQLCMNAYNNNQDANVFIGDLGLGYDRWYAYIRETVHPASYYDEDEIQVVTDRVHPSWRGAKQMGESIIPCIVRACNL